jgi:GNAT superfamily N-acetyltransferase
MPTIRNYQSADAQEWLRCRTLAFLTTCYYDDVWTARPTTPAIQLVSIVDENLVGLLDVEIDQELATIDTVAVHPDYQNQGIGTALLRAAVVHLPRTVQVLDAWTREDPATLSWYRSRGFAESEHYLHVYKGWQESDDGWTSPSPLARPVMAFCHAKLEHEAELRERFARVYVCRRFSRPTAAFRGVVGRE